MAALSTRRWVLWAAAFVYVFAVFGFNLMSCAPTAWVHAHSTGSDELVWARLHALNPPNEAPFLLRPGTLPPCPLPLQDLRAHELFPASHYETAWIYAPHCVPESPAAYASQVGLQGWAVQQVYAALQAGLQFLQNPPARVVYGLWGVRLLQSALAAAVVAAITLWMAAEFGGVAYALGVLTVSCSPWLTVFAHSVYWQLWLLLLPFAVSAWLCRAGARWAWWAAVPLCVGLKATMGYEYLTTLVLSAAVPQVYYACKAQQPWRRIVGHNAVMAALCVLAFAGVLAWHANAVGHGSWEAGLRIVSERAAARTYPSADTVGEGADLGKDASVVGCVFMYLLRFHTYNALYVPFIVWLALFCASARATAPGPQRRANCVALAVAVAAPMSWFVLAKGHSVVHPHLNFVLWHLPMTWLGWGVVGRQIAGWRPFSFWTRSQVPD